MWQLVRLVELICELEDDAQLVRYDVCSKSPGFYDGKYFSCLGLGVIHSVGGEPWPYKDQRYFFVRRTEMRPK